MLLKAIIPGQNTGRKQLLLQDIHEIKQILGIAVADIINRIRRQGQAGAEESAELPSERLRSIILCVAAAGIFKNHTLKGVFSGLLQRIQPSGIHIRKTLMPVVRRMDIIAE